MSHLISWTTLRTVIFCGALAFGGGAFAADTAAPAAAAAAEEEGLTFFDSSSFDMSLASELSKRPELTLVLPSGPFSPNQIPVRLEKWLAVVARTGGSVKLKRDAGAAVTRGILSDVVDLTVKSQAESELSAMYATAQNYDVVVTFNGNDVTSVRFVRRAEPAAETGKK